MPVVLDDLLIGAVIGGTSGLVSLIGSYMEGEISKGQFDRMMALKQRSLDAEIKNAARSLGMREQEARNQMKRFMEGLEQRREEFKVETGLARERIGLERERLEFEKFRELVNPILQQHRRSKNLLTAFSGIVKQAGGAFRPAAPAVPVAPTAPTQPIQALPTAQLAPTNPLTRGV